MPRGKKVTEQEYKHIKYCQSVGINANKTSKITGRSAPTIGQIFKSESYQEFCNPVVDKVEEPKDTPRTQEVQQANDVVTILETINDNYSEILNQLEAISMSVKWIENHTEVKPRSRLFG